MKIEQIIEDGIEYVVETDFSSQRWYWKDQLHRELGPAIIRLSNVWTSGVGNQYWYYHGKLHRGDGPAVIWYNGNQEWWYHNTWLKQIESQPEFEQWLRLRVFK